MDKKQIQNISTKTEQSILRKTAYALPDRPSESGMRTDEIKKAFYSGMTDKTDSLLSETKRIVEEANEIFDEIESGIDELNNNKLDSSQVSNPNLLINGDFRVNQRGQTSYESDYSYSLDRWYSTPGATITLNEDGTITIKNNSDTDRVWFSQKFEDYNFYKGKTVTYSVNVKSISGHVGMYVGGDTYVGDSYLALQQGLNKHTFTIPEESIESSFGFYITVNEGCEITLEYAKLELGSVATLFTPRLYSEELVLCQYYYRRIKLLSPIAFAQETNKLNVQIPIGNMREYRTVSLVSYGIWIRGNTQYIDVTELAFGGVYGFGGITPPPTLAMTIIFVDGSPFTLETHYTLDYIEVEIDAEIY